MAAGFRVRFSARVFLFSGIGFPLLLPAQEVRPASTVAATSSDAQTAALAKALIDTFKPIAEAASVEAELLISNDNEVNAYATIAPEGRVVVVHRRLLDLFSQDRAVVAAVLAHEIAHHAKGHIEQMQEKHERTAAGGAILGTLAGIAIGHEHGDLAGATSRAAVELGAGLLVLKFSRKQELEADAEAIELLEAAGLDPYAMVRLQDEISALDTRAGSLLSTHPSSKRRMKKAKERVADLGAGNRAFGRPQPLVSREALDDALASIESRKADMARITANGGGDFPAVPIRSISESNKSLLARVIEGYRQRGIPEESIPNATVGYEKYCMTTPSEEACAELLRGAISSLKEQR